MPQTTILSHLAGTKNGGNSNDTFVDPEMMLGDDEEDDDEGFDPDSTLLDFAGGEKEMPKLEPSTDVKPRKKPKK
jgi:hypothetical protein